MAEQTQHPSLESDLPATVSAPGSADWVLFGATGVTGRMVLERAAAAGLPPRLVGRRSPALAELAAESELAMSSADLNDSAALVEALGSAKLILNAAGPYTVTAAPLIQAAMQTGADYLDLNGELSGIVELLGAGSPALAAGVALVGGCGFGVAASDGLAAAVSTQLGGAEWLRISVAADSAYSSPAVTESLLNVLRGGGREVESRLLTRRRLARVHWSQSFDGVPQSFASAPLAELAAAQFVTHAPRILAGVPMPRSQAMALRMTSPLLPALLKLPPVGAAMARTGGHSGSDAHQRTHTSRVVVAGGRGDHLLSGYLTAGEGFGVAADIAVAAVRAALNHRPAPGAHTPATAFGPDFITTVPRVSVTYRGD